MRGPDDANELSVRLELQADCLAGVWAARPSFTHGTSEQRAEWLRTGFGLRGLDASDSFAGDI